MKQPLALAATCALAAASALPLAISWHVRRPLPEGIAGGAGGYLDHTLLYAGGTTWRNGQKIWLASVHRYNPAQDAWQESTALPEALAYGPAVTGSDYVEILGGMTGSGPSLKCWRLHKGETTWRHTGDLPRPAALGRAEMLLGRTYVFGGCPDVADLSGCSDSVLVRTENGDWQSTAKLSSGPMALSASSSAGDRVYLFGGCAPVGAGAIRNSSESWSFTPSTGTWRKLRPLPAATRALAAIRLDSRRLLLSGGYYASQDEAKLHGPEFGFSKAVWIYHIDRDEYEPVASLPDAVAGIELIAGEGRYFAAGGEDRARNRSRALLQLRLH